MTTLKIESIKDLNIIKTTYNLNSIIKTNAVYRYALSRELTFLSSEFVKAFFEMKKAQSDLSKIEIGLIYDEYDHDYEDQELAYLQQQ